MQLLFWFCGSLSLLLIWKKTIRILQVHKQNKLMRRFWIFKKVIHSIKLQGIFQIPRGTVDTTWLLIIIYLLSISLRTFQITSHVNQLSIPPFTPSKPSLIDFAVVIVHENSKISEIKMKQDFFLIIRWVSFNWMFAVYNAVMCIMFKVWGLWNSLLQSEKVIIFR